MVKIGGMVKLPYHRFRMVQKVNFFYHTENYHITGHMALTGDMVTIGGMVARLIFSFGIV
jgi:hypothetical protein